MIDAQIESRNWAAVMSGKPVRQTQGYTIAESNVQLIKQEPDIQDAFAALPDDVKAIMDQEAA